MSGPPQLSVYVNDHAERASIDAAAAKESVTCHVSSSSVSPARAATSAEHDIQDHFLQLPLSSGRPTSSILPTDCIPSAKAVAIERLTRSQSNSVAWHKHRKTRLTAYLFHRIVNRQANINSAFLQILSTPPTYLSHFSPLRHGLLKEADAATNYLSKMGNLGHKNMKLYPVGLCVHPDHSYIAAFPDRLVFDPMSSPP